MYTFIWDIYIVFISFPLKVYSSYSSYHDAPELQNVANMMNIMMYFCGTLYQNLQLLRHDSGLLLWNLWELTVEFEGVTVYNNKGDVTLCISNFIFVHCAHLKLHRKLSEVS